MREPGGGDPSTRPPPLRTPPAVTETQPSCLGAVAGYHPIQDASHIETNSHLHPQLKFAAKSVLPVWPSEGVFGLCQGAGVAA